MRPGSVARSRGFTLNEMLIVVTGIAVVLAIAIPSLRSSRIASNESAAISYMRSWIPAQEQYHKRHGVYADRDEQLVEDGLLLPVPEGDNNGYRFQLDNPPNHRYAWWGRAFPKISGKTGVRKFYLDSRGVLRFTNDGGFPNHNSTPLGTK